jgi:ferritin
MKTALALEKTVNEALFQLHEVAVSNKDDEVGVMHHWFVVSH